MKDEARDLARKFDHGSMEQMQDPYSKYQRFRSECPLAHSDSYDGFYLVSRYDDVCEILQDHRRFSATSGTGIPPVPFQMCPTDIDPPEQTQYRKLLNPRFTKDALEKLRPEIIRIAHELIDSFIEAGEADLASQFARPLLPRIILPLVGVPYEDQPQISEWAEFLSHWRGVDPEGCAKVSEALHTYLLELISRRRLEGPADDLLSLLLFEGVGGRQLDDQDVFGAVMILLFGGLDTTSAVVLDALWQMDRDRAIRERLIAQPELWPDAMEEFVRFASPVQGVTRLLMQEQTHIAGGVLPKGEIVMPLIASANRDESQFDEAARCIIDRKRNRHIGFGTGAHTCLGRNLARLEGEIMLRALLERIPDYATPAGFEPKYSPSEVRGMWALPVTFTPGAQRGEAAA